MQYIQKDVLIVKGFDPLNVCIDDAMVWVWSETQKYRYLGNK